MTPASLRQMIEAATPCHDVEISWYHIKQKDGSTIAHPQFETDTGSVAQSEDDYKLYCALRNQAPQILALWEAALGTVKRCPVCNGLGVLPVSNGLHYISHDCASCALLRAALAGMEAGPTGRQPDGSI